MPHINVHCACLRQRAPLVDDEAWLCICRVRTQEDEQWTDAFDRASDAIGWSANREQAWDDLLSQPGANNVVQVCVCVCVCVCLCVCVCVRVRSYMLCVCKCA